MGILAAIPFFKNEVPHRLGSEHPHRVPSRNYETSDGTYMHVICNQSQWLKLCDALDLGEKYKREPYTSDLGRLEDREEIDKQIQSVLLTKAGKEWIELFNHIGVPCSLVNSLDQVLNSEQTKARDLIIKWEQDGLGEVPGLNFPYKFLNSASKIKSPVPKLGEHTSDILEEFGYTQSDIDSLKQEGII